MNIEDKKREYVRLGLATKLFTYDDLPKVNEKLKGVRLIIDNTIPGDAVVQVVNGVTTITYNERLCKAHGDYYVDEVIFHELSHIINDIHNDIYGGNKKIANYLNKAYEKYEQDKNTRARYPNNMPSNSGYMYNYGGYRNPMGEAMATDTVDLNSLFDNPLTENSLYGAIVLDEAMSQKMAQSMVEAKYGKKYYHLRRYVSRLAQPPMSFDTDFGDYPEFEYYAQKFAEILGIKGGLLGMCKQSVKNKLVPNMFAKFDAMNNGDKKLNGILGYLSTIYVADSTSKGRPLRFGAECNKPSNVHLAMNRASWMMDFCKQDFTPNYEPDFDRV